MNYTNRKFRIHSSNGNPRLAEGVIGDYLGTKDELEYYNATVTIMFNPNNVHEVQAQVAIRDLGECDEFFMRTQGAGRMGDYTTQLEWI